MKLQAAFAVLACCTTVLAATAEQWRGRSIYQVMTDRFARTDNSTTATCDTLYGLYCGGTWQGLMNNLDYIQGMGFTAVWISPVTYQLQGNTPDGSAYHGYWQTDLYQLNAKFGTADDLKSLSSALHSRGMYLMVDVVVNHNAWYGNQTSVNYTTFNPFNSAADYHAPCYIDYDNDTSLVDCWLGDDIVPLPDLKTEAPNVAQGYQTWITQLVSNYSIDGLRLDSAREVDTGFWAGFEQAAGIFITGEVYDGDSNYACGFQNYLDSILNYPIYFPAIAAFSSTNGSISALVNQLSSVASACNDPTVLGSFTENQDVPRFGQLNSDLSLAQNVIAFTMLTDGIPIIYEGQEQHYQSSGGSGVPYNREAVWFSDYNTSAPLYTLVSQLNGIRNWAMSVNGSYLTSLSDVVYSDSSTIVMSKGTPGNLVMSVLGNLGVTGSSYTLKLNGTGFRVGEMVVDVLTCDTVTADGSGNIAVPMADGLPRVYYPVAALDGSGICSDAQSDLESRNCEVIYVYE